MIRVLFVCTGNICRSPTADGVLRHLVGMAGLTGRIAVDSAGTHGYHLGDPPDPRSVAAAARHGVDLTGLRARRLDVADFTAFDHLIAMDRGHLRVLHGLAPTAAARAQAALFCDLIPGRAGQDVPDPYYGDLPGFDRVYALIAEGCGHILAGLRA